MNGIFWKIGSKLAEGIEDLGYKLKVARMGYTAGEWMSFCAKYMIINSLFAGVISFFLMGLLFENIAVRILISLNISVVILVITLLTFIWYPEAVIASRRKKIENALPFVTYYMATIASSGIPPYRIFKMIARFKEFGEIARECEEITRGIEVFGYTFPEAIERAIKLSPSPKWKELLTSILSTVTSGGDLRKMLMERARRYTEDFRRNLQSFSQSVSLLLEVYITVVLVGTIMSTVVILLVGLMGGLSKTLILMQYFMALFLLPLVSIAFIFLIKGMSPIEV